MTFSTGAGFWRTWGCPRCTNQMNHMIFILFSENIFQLQMIRKQSARIHQSLILCRLGDGDKERNLAFFLLYRYTAGDNICR